MFLILGMFRFSLPDCSSGRMISVLCEWSNCRWSMRRRVKLPGSAWVGKVISICLPKAVDKLMPCGWAVWTWSREDGERRGISVLRGWRFGGAGKGRRRTLLLALEPNQGGKEKGNISPKQCYLIEVLQGCKRSAFAQSIWLLLWLFTSSQMWLFTLIF